MKIFSKLYKNKIIDWTYNVWHYFNFILIIIPKSDEMTFKFDIVKKLSKIASSLI